MKKTSFIIIFSVLLALALQNFVVSSPEKKITNSETALQQAIRTGTLHCSYAFYAPSLEKDIKTGTLKGYSYDIMQEVGKRLGINIDWVEETGYGLIAESLNSRRTDMFCGATAINPHRSKYMRFSTPLFYIPMNIYVRSDDFRFTNVLSVLNNAAFKIAVIDGDISDTIVRSDFPKAMAVAFSQSTSYGQIFEELVAKKVDAVISDPVLAESFQKHATASIRKLDSEYPVRIIPIGFSLPLDAYDLQNAIDVTLQELANEGFIKKCIEKHTENHNSFKFPVRP